jgi:hypothetical protein
MVDKLNIAAVTLNCAVTEIDGSFKKWYGSEDAAEALSEEEQAQVDAAYATAVAEETTTQYQRTRAEAYPSIQEQLDMQYWDSVNGTTTWADAIAAVKAANPKPE